MKLEAILEKKDTNSKNFGKKLHLKVRQKKDHRTLCLCDEDGNETGKPVKIGLEETYRGYHVDVWEERDNLQITLYDSDDKEIRSWSDDDARQMFEDGFFNSKNLEKSVVEYAKDMGWI